MSVEWQVLERKEHPTLEAIIQILRALDTLGNEKPESQSAADDRLRYAAKQASLIGKPDGKDASSLSPESLLKKADRLDRYLGTKIHKIFRDWQDKNVTDYGWNIETRPEYERVRHSLLKIVDAYQHALRTDESPSPPISISVLTTRLLDARLWPRVLHDFFDELRRLGQENVRVDISTIEPYAVAELAAGGSTYDLSVTYCAQAELPEPSPRYDVKYIALHRCLLGVEANLGSSRSLDEVFNSEAIVILRTSEQLLQDFPWSRVLGKTERVYRGTTLAIHAYCRSGCGVGISHEEFLDEVEQKELEVRELPSDQFGNSVLLLMRPIPSYPPVGPTEIKKGECISILQRIVDRHFTTIESNYARSKELTRNLSSLTHSYSTVFSFYPDGRKPPMDVWRGAISLQVTASLFVHGSVKIFGDEESPNLSRRSSQKYGIFGRIEFPKGSLCGQMVLRAMNKQKDEISMASILVECVGDELRCPGLHNEPCLIGHWIGKEWGDESDGSKPNAGIWIWHKDKDLSLEEINTLIAKYRLCSPVPFLPGKVRKLLGKPEI